MANHIYGLQDISHHRRFTPPPPRRFAPIFKTFRPRRRDDLSSLRRKFRPPCKTFRTHGRRFAPLCQTFRPKWKTFSPGPLYISILHVRRFAPIIIGRFAPYANRFAPVLIGRFAPWRRRFTPVLSFSSNSNFSIIE